MSSDGGSRGFKGAAATVASGFVVTIAFAAPVLRLLTWAIEEQRSPRGTPMVDDYAEFLGNSVVLALDHDGGVRGGRRAHHQRPTVRQSERLVGSANRLSAVGYAVPGPVVAMGVVVALVALDDRLEQIGLGLPGAVATGSFLALAYAYVIRFLAPAIGIGRGRARAGSRRDDGVGALARRLAHAGCSAGSICRCRAPAC